MPKLVLLPLADELINEDKNSPEDKKQKKLKNSAEQKAMKELRSQHPIQISVAFKIPWWVVGEGE